MIDAKANFDSVERVVYVRVASHEGKLYLDRCDPAWSAIEIDETGWRMVAEPPVRFRRSSGSLELPLPERGGSIDELKPFLNVRHVRDFVLVVAWTLAALIDRGPYPVLAFSGEQGVAKSTASKILRALIDPNTAPLRALPRNDRELFISANNAHLLVFDNVSGLPPWLSDTMCRLSSGGGFAVRTLYTNNEEVLFDAARPQILNGIGDVITRPDLADRALFITLKPIPENKRRSDRELLAALEKKRPRILGALLDALVVGLRRLPTIKLPELPRMADFAVWATACEQAFWKERTFMNAYDENLVEVVDTVIEADLVGSAVLQMSLPWKGTAARLLTLLREGAEEGEIRSKEWPNSPRALADQLRRAATFLRKIDVEISFHREGKDRVRLISIHRRENPASAASASSADPSTASDSIWLEADAGLSADAAPSFADAESLEADAEEADAEADTKKGSASASQSASAGVPQKIRAADAADAADAENAFPPGGKTRI